MDSIKSEKSRNPPCESFSVVLRFNIPQEWCVRRQPGNSRFNILKASTKELFAIILSVDAYRVELPLQRPL